MAWFTPKSNGTLFCSELPIEDFPKAISYANTHKMQIEILPCKIAGFYQENYFTVILTPESHLLHDQKFQI